MKTETVTTSNGHLLTGFDGDVITDRVKRRGLYEKSTLDFLRAYFKGAEGLIVADVGGNIGNHTLDFSTYAAKVYTFEPVDRTFALLKQNVEQNNISNVTLINRALSDEVGVAEIFIVPENIGASSFDERIVGSEKVEVIKIIGDDYFIEQNIERLDFIKIDVEGHEERALKGLMKTIQRFRPVILMEWCDVEAIKDINASRFMDQLESLYTIAVLGGNHDSGFWQNKPWGRFRRRLSKTFVSHRAVLYPFNEDEQYRNILLIPK